jgi:hypothetical protein
MLLARATPLVSIQIDEAWSRMRKKRHNVATRT